MSDSVVQDIKDRLDVVELVGSYLPLRRAGINWKTNCPFHNEKTPSFNVNPQKQIWHCFGCGEGGDIFTFVQKYEHLEFPEALKLLADRAGVSLPVKSSQEGALVSRKEKLWKINAFVAKYYHAYLFSKDGKKALEYLTSRGLTEETIKTWQIGYAPFGQGVLEKILKSKGVGLKDLTEAGVVVGGHGGRNYDRFYGRVTFPILDFRGKVAGFSARLLEDRSGAAKYVNSPENEVYKKGELLFGLHLAKNSISKAGEVVVVEGQMDCIKAYQAGFQNTVATSGTAMTEKQMLLLKRLTDKISFAFDGDEAGVKALYRTSLLALPKFVDVKVISYSDVKDPDELISKDPTAWKKAVANALPVIEHYLLKAGQDFEPLSLSQKRYVSTEVLPLLAKVSSHVEQDHYLKLISQRFNSSVVDLRDELFRQAKGDAPEQPVSWKKDAVGGVGKIEITQLERRNLRLEQLVLGGFKYPEFLKKFKEEAEISDFTDLRIKTTAEVLVQGRELGVAEQGILQHAEFVLESLGEELGGNEERLKSELTKIFYTFRLTALKRQQENLTFHIQAAEAAKDSNAVEFLRKEFAALLGRRLELERKIEKQN